MGETTESSVRWVLRRTLVGVVVAIVCLVSVLSVGRYAWTAGRKQGMAIARTQSLETPLSQIKVLATAPESSAVFSGSLLTAVQDVYALDVVTGSLGTRFSEGTDCSALQELFSPGEVAIWRRLRAVYRIHRFSNDAAAIVVFFPSNHVVTSVHAFLGPPNPALQRTRFTRR